MILGAEIGMVAFGLYAIFSGKLKLTKNRIVRGTPARLLGILGLLPIPISIGIGILLVLSGRIANTDSFRLMGAAIEASVLLLCLAAMYLIGWQFAGPPD